jgi:hypothetical protein
MKLKEWVNKKPRATLKFILNISKLDALLESTLKQNETDLLLAQKNANMFKSSVEQLEFSFNEQKILNNTLQDQVSFFGCN